MSNIKPTTHWVLSQWGCYNHHLVLINNRLLFNFGLGLMGNKKWSHLLSSEKKGVWPLRRKKNITRGLICISSKLPGWMKTSTCSGSRAHLFQELGMKKKTKFYFASNKVKHSMKHAEIRLTLQFTSCLKTTLTKSSPLMQDVVGWWKLKLAQQWKHGWKRRTISINSMIDFQQR